MARTRVKLRRPYRLQTTLDLGELVLVARYDASRENACTASLPQAPYDSATRGIHVHPNSEHLASLAECFLSSAATAADPAVRPASEIKVGLSGDTTVRSKAAGLPQSQLEAIGCQQGVCSEAHVLVHYQPPPWRLCRHDGRSEALHP